MNESTADSYEWLEQLPWPSALLDSFGKVRVTSQAWRSTESPVSGPAFAVGVSYAQTVAELCRDSQVARELEAAFSEVLSGGARERELTLSSVARSALRISATHGVVHGLLVQHIAADDRHTHTDAVVAARTGELAAVNTRLRQVNAQLREAQRLQRGILDSIPDMAWLKDAKGRILAVNRPFAEACGSTPDELAGKTDFDCWVHELAERYRNDDQHVMASRAMKRVEEPLVDRLGQQIWIETVKVPISNDAGEVIGTAGIARDITERKRAEAILRRSHAELERLVEERTEELRQANEALRADIAMRERVEREQRRLVAILEATTDFVGITDTSGRVTYLNRAGRRLMGWPETLDVTQTSIEQYHPEWAAELVLQEGMAAAMRDGYWRGETALLSADGRQIPVSQLLIVHRDAAGNPEFLSTIARDVSERKLLEAQLLQSQKMEAIGRLAGGIAHDFNNLLTVILGYCELTLTRVGADELQQENLNIIQSAAERAASLTRQLLAFARKQMIEPRVIDINRQILEVDGMLRRLIGADIELVTVTGAQSLPVKIDPGQLQQILVNLALNARDAMPEGGKLTIETRHLSAEEVLLGARPALSPGEYVLLIVRDTGTGMSRDVLDHVFEPFFTTKDVGKGTGLGLATCYGIVKQAGGDILVHSGHGAGTSFQIYLPRSSAELVAPESHHSPRLEVRGTETVLVVEDEPVVRAIAERALRERGYTVLSAERGTEALAIASDYAGTIHLLLTDLVMPQMSGRQVADRVRVVRPDIKVLYMSGYADAALAPQRDRAATFVSKPFTPLLLLQRVREILDHGRKEYKNALVGSETNNSKT